MVTGIVIPVAGNNLVIALLYMVVMQISNLHLLSTLKCAFELWFKVNDFVPSCDVDLENNVSGSFKPAERKNQTQIIKEIEQELSMRLPCYVCHHLAHQY
jgi:hypothetical protein